MSSMKITTASFAPSTLLVALVACGSGGSGGTSTLGGGSGVDESKRLVDATGADRRAFCDWTASLYGGYGGTKHFECDGGSVTIHGPKSSTDCLAEAASVASACTATVGELEACVSAIAAEDACAPASSAVSAACGPLASKGCKLGG